MWYEKKIIEKCPLCKSKDYQFIMTKYDDRYGYDDEFDIYKCENCNCSFIKNPIKEEYIWDLYVKYYAKRFYTPKEEWYINTISNIISKFKIRWFLDKLTGNIHLWYFIEWKNNLVLDYGCGTDLNYQVAKSKIKQWIWMDVNAPIIKWLRKEWYKCYVWTLDDISNIEEKFDYILMSQVIEHTYNPIETIRNAKKILNKGGKIIISTPNLDSKYIDKYKENWINWHVPYHTILFNKKAFEYLAEEIDLKISNISTITPTNWFLIQKNVKSCKRWEKNLTFKSSISIIRTLFISIGLFFRRLFWEKYKEDNLIVELYK